MIKIFISEQLFYFQHQLRQLFHIMKNSIQYFSLALFMFFIGCSGGATSITIDLIGLDDMKYAVKDTADYLETSEEIEVEGKDYYLLEGIHAEPGQSITINLKTISDFDPSAMAHNWVLLYMTAAPQEFSLESQEATDNEYISPELEEQVIAHSEVIGHGESTSVKFSAPDSAGNYDYICTYPGHYTGGMGGILYVNEDIS